MQSGDPDQYCVLTHICEVLMRLFNMAINIRFLTGL